MLYNQNSNSNGTGINSQNFTSTYSKTYNAAGADDFVVPKKTTWTVTEVDMLGIFYNGSGPATSENVTFYKDNKGVPGKAAKGGTFTDLNGTRQLRFLHYPLGKKGVKLKSGHYWVSVVANCGFLTVCGQWGWYLNGTIHNDAAVWENPGNGFGTGCTAWGAFRSVKPARTRATSCSTCRARRRSSKLPAIARKGNSKCGEGGHVPPSLFRQLLCQRS